jgi:response regulator NasT
LTQRASNDHVMAYLVKPVKQADIEVAITMALARFEQFQAVRREARTLAKALEDRKVIERAKGVIMKRLRVDEQEGFRRLKKYASDHNLKLVEFAHTLLSAEEVFAGMEKL